MVNQGTVFLMLIALFKHSLAGNVIHEEGDFITEDYQYRFY